MIKEEDRYYSYVIITLDYISIILAYAIAAPLSSLFIRRGADDDANEDSALIWNWHYKPPRKSSSGAGQGVPETMSWASSSVLGRTFCRHGLLKDRQPPPD